MTDRTLENAQERRPKTPLECRDWIGERMENALRIAMSKQGEDRAGWLEDAHYFSSVLSILIKEVNAAPPATQTAGMVPITDLQLVVDFFSERGAANWEIVKKWKAALAAGKEG